MRNITRQIIAIILLGFFIYPFARAVETKCIFCCNVGCDGAQPAPASPTPTPTATPTPSPSPSPTPTPGNMPMTFATTMYYPNSGPPGNAADQARLAKIKTYATIMMEFWYASSSYCNAALTAPTTVTICGPYFDFGFLFYGDCFWDQASQWKLGTDTHNLYNPNPNTGVGCWVNSSGACAVESVMDYTDPDYVDWYSNVLVNGCSPDFTAKAGSGHNAMFFDNGVFDSSWVWNTYPITAATNKSRAKTFLTSVSSAFHANGDKIVMNIWSDVTATWSNDPTFYRSVMDLVDYAMYEATVSDYGSGTPKGTSDALNAIDKAFDYNTNSSTVVLWTTEYGDFWYQFVTGLFTCTSTKCGYWQQPAMTDAQISIVTNLGIGTPTANYALSGCYYRTFTNGVAVANLTSSSCNYTLPAGNYTDVIAGGTVSGQRTLAAHTGKIYRGPL